MIHGGGSAERMANPAMVTEYKVKRTSYFRVETTDDTGKVISRRDVRIKLRSTKADDGRIHYLLYSDSGTILPGTWGYLNDHLLSYADNTRKMRAYSLRQLFSFLTVYCLSLQRFTATEVQKYIQFLKGLSTADRDALNIRLRGNSTINFHLDTMRDFAIYLGYENRCFKEARPAKFHIITTELEVPMEMDTMSYKYNMKEYREEGLAPRYITEEEYGKVRRWFEDRGDTAGVLMVDLMYLYGLRRGEALGLTLEDICEAIEKGEYIFFLLLRNRMSDRMWQSCKNMSHPESKIEYRRSSYRKATQTVVLDENTYSLLLGYIDEIHVKMKEDKETYSRSIADIVDRESFEADENHYLFLNKWGGILTGNAWNKRLRECFIDCGIAVDIDSRKTNLSHRFRHGFAMHQVHSSTDILTLQKMMRHRSVNSLASYYNPTAQEELQLKMEFQNSLKEEMGGDDI